MLCWPVRYTDQYQTLCSTCNNKAIVKNHLSMNSSDLQDLFFLLPVGYCASIYQYFFHDYGVPKIQREEVFINCSYYTLKRDVVQMP